MIKYLVVGGISIIVKYIADNTMEDSPYKTAVDGGCVAISLYCAVKIIINAPIMAINSLIE